MEPRWSVYVYQYPACTNEAALSIAGGVVCVLNGTCHKNNPPGVERSQET